MVPTKKSTNYINYIIRVDINYKIVTNSYATIVVKHMFDGMVMVRYWLSCVPIAFNAWNLEISSIYCVHKFDKRL